MVRGPSCICELWDELKQVAVHSLFTQFTQSIWQRAHSCRLCGHWRHVGGIDCLDEKSRR